VITKKQDTMTDNYPPGAANDPSAPYNEPRSMETEITVRSRLIKETVIETCETHTVIESEIEPDGSVSRIAFVEPDNDLLGEYDLRYRRPTQIIRDCQTIARQLVADGKCFYAHVYLPTLIDDCQDWEEEEIVISE